MPQLVKNTVEKRRAAAARAETLHSGDYKLMLRDFDPIGYAGCGPEFYCDIFAIFRRAGLSFEDALEQTQETCVKALKSLRDGDLWPDTPEAWKSKLKVMARSVHLDYRRKQNGRGKTKRPRMIPFSSFRKEKDSDASHPLELDAAVQKAGDTARTEWLDLLEIRGGAQVADVVELVEAGHTHKEIAGLLGVSVRTVEKRLRLARDIVSAALSA